MPASQITRFRFPLIAAAAFAVAAAGTFGLSRAMAAEEQTVETVTFQQQPGQRQPAGERQPGERPPGDRPAPGPRGPGGPGGGGAGAQSLDASMKAMNRAYKQIGRQLEDAAQDASTLKLINDLQLATVAGKGVVPPQLAKLSAEEQKAPVAEYRKHMLNTLKYEIELESAVVAGDRAAAKAAYAKIDEEMKHGHKEFRVKEE